MWCSRLGYSEAGRERARAMVKSFKEFIEEHRNDIHALQVLYSVPYAERLTFRDVKDLAETLSRPPRNWTTDRLWAAYDQLDRDKVPARANASSQMSSPWSASPWSRTMSWYRSVIAWRRASRDGWQCKNGEVQFTGEQRRWLGWMKDHIATSMGIDAERSSCHPSPSRAGSEGQFRCLAIALGH